MEENQNNSNKRILIIEDDQFIREFYEELLTAEGYNIEVAADGELGLQKILEGGYSLILLDIMLPKRDGVSILRELVTNKPKVENGQIVILTNLGQDSVIKVCFELGASGYLIKSALNPDQVLTEIRNYLTSK